MIHDTYPGFLVGEPLGILELSGKRHLDLRKLRHLGLGLLQLAEQVRVLNGQLLLSGIQIIKSTVGLISPTLHFVELVLQLFGDLFLGSLLGYTKVNHNIMKKIRPLQVVQQ